MIGIENRSGTRHPKFFFQGIFLFFFTKFLARPVFQFFFIHKHVFTLLDKGIPKIEVREGLQDVIACGASAIP